MPKKAGMEAWKRKRNIEYLQQKEYQYYIFCEGEQTEPNYFNGFKKIIDDSPIYKNMVSVKIEPIGAETLYVMGQAEAYIHDQQIQKGQVWCVYDKDSFPAERFDGVVTRTNELNKQNSNIQYHCAWSNQCIELWFILHFSYYQSDNHRRYYVDYLNGIFEKKKLGKYEKNMTNIFDILLNYGDPKMASRFARKLLMNSKDKQPSDIAPGTKVYELVEELAQYLPCEIKEKFIDIKHAKCLQ